MRRVVKLGASMTTAQHAPPGAANREGRSGVDPVAFEPVATETKTIRIGLLGCGNVGAALVQLVARQTDAIEARTGVRLEITRVAVRNISRERDVELADGVLTRDTHSVVVDPSVD